MVCGKLCRNTMASSPPEQWGESDETSSIFCGHVNFTEMNGGISV